ncbi:MAG: hypothetical protein ACKVQT_01140 [Burkholderiales bacterium]
MSGAHNLERRIVSGSSNERGVVLFIVLIVLVAMSMAAISMFRSVDTGSIVAGNLAFKQNALLSADAAAEQARTWVNANVLLLDGDNPANGYYANRQDSLDLMGTRTPGNLADDVDWSGTNSLIPTKAIVLPVDPTTGNQVSYVVHRLCAIGGSVNSVDPAQNCAVASSNAAGSTQDAVEYGNYGLSTQNAAYFRITARILGPRQTVTLVQSTILP